MPIASLGYTSDYVANGSFAALKENVTYLREPGYARLIRLQDYRNDWSGDAVYVDRKSFDFLRKSVVYPGDIVIANVGAYAGTVFRVPDLGMPMALGPNAVLLRVDDDYDQEYVFQYLSSPYGWALLRSIVSGSAQPKFNKTDLRALEVPLPPVAVQRKIASVLSAYDELIENNRRRIELLEEMAQRIHREWFVDLRYPGHETVPLVESEIGPIPTGWTTANLFDVADLTFGHPFKSGLFNEEHGTPVVRIRDIPVGESLTLTTEQPRSSVDVRNGDILIGMDGDFHMALWSAGTAWLNQRVTRVRPTSPLFCRLSLFQALRKPITEWNHAIVGTTVAHLGKRHLERITLLVPDCMTAQRCAALFDPILEEEITLKRAGRSLRAARNLLLPRLLSGEIELDRLDITMEEPVA